MSDTIKTEVETTPSNPSGHLASPSPASTTGVSLCTGCSSKPVRYENRGLCHTCYTRGKRGGKVGKPRKHSVTLSPTCAYDAAHTRCKNLWGSAGNYPCVKCGKKAREWAYDGTDPTELTGHSGDPTNVARQERRGGAEMKYSAWPEFYMPMCRGCHAEFDHPGEVIENPNW